MVIILVVSLAIAATIGKIVSKTRAEETFVPATTVAAVEAPEEEISKAEVSTVVVMAVAEDNHNKDAVDADHTRAKVTTRTTIEDNNTITRMATRIAIQTAVQNQSGVAMEMTLTPGNRTPYRMMDIIPIDPKRPGSIGGETTP
jgi:hypothetical protein